MSVLSDVIKTGTHADIPAASSSNDGYLYFETDTYKLFRSNGSAWVQVAAAANLSAFDPAAIDGTGTFALSGDISPSQLTANQNDYNPTGLSAAAVLRLSSDASRDITGLQGGADGRILVLANVGSNNIVLKDESGSSSAGNRFALTADITLSADSMVIIQYDSTSSRWRALSGGGGGSNSFVTIQVSGQSDVVADSPTDTLTLVAGTNVIITTNAGADTITIAAAGGSTDILAVQIFS